MFQLNPNYKPTPKEAIELLKANEPLEGYFGCFSGGKDSVVIKELARLAAVRVKWFYMKTTIDPPPVIKFIKSYHPDVQFVRPPNGNFFKRMLKKGFPTRRMRWCCDEYKKIKYPTHAVVIMGIRAEESPNRSKWWSTKGKHFKYGNIVLNPIFYWSSDELWDFIHDNKIPYCHLYDEGFSRLGCVGCPMSKEGRKREFARWPKYEQKWKRAFQKIWELRSGTNQRNGGPWFGNVYFDDWEQMYKWWLNDRSLPNPKQLKLFE